MTCHDRVPPGRPRRWSERGAFAFRRPRVRLEVRGAVPTVGSSHRRDLRATEKDDEDPDERSQSRARFDPRFCAGFHRTVAPTLYSFESDR